MSDDADLPMKSEMTPDPLFDRVQRDALDHSDLASLEADAVADPALFETRDEELPYARQVITTPFHFEVARESTTNLWRPWNGYTVADVLTSIDAEYAALRQRAALTDITPLFKYRISGNDALAWLRRFVAGNLIGMTANEILRVVFCEDRGHVVGDGLLFCLGKNDFRLITETPHLAWMHDSTIGYQVHIEDVTTTLAAMSLQGPLAASVLADAGFAEIEKLGVHKAQWFDVGGIPVYVSRNGLWGELAYDIWIDPEDAGPIWSRLMSRGEPFGLRATGFALREIARVEAGLPRAGVDYLGAFSVIDPENAMTPFELGFDTLVNLETGHFTGRDALRAHADKGPRRSLVPLAIDSHEPLAFSSIRSGGNVVGIATSSAFSPSLGLNLALGIISAAGLKENVSLYVEAEIREELSVRIMKTPARILKETAIFSPSAHEEPAPLLALF